MEARAHAEARGESGEGRGGGGARSRSAPDMRARTYDAPRGWGGDSRMALRMRRRLAHGSEDGEETRAWL